MFKEMKCSFNVVEKNDAHLKAVIKRELSGASAYGDRSSHSLEFFNENGEKIFGDCEYFDTRYGQITTKDNEWVVWWFDFLLGEKWKHIQYNSDLEINEVE